MAPTPITPPTTEPISIRLAPLLIRRLAAQAAAEGCTRHRLAAAMLAAACAELPEGSGEVSR